MKLILAELLTRYDMKLIPGTAPKRMMLSIAAIPETKLKVLMRQAQKE